MSFKFVEYFLVLLDLGFVVPGILDISLFSFYLVFGCLNFVLFHNFTDLDKFFLGGFWFWFLCLICDLGTIVGWVVSILLKRLVLFWSWLSCLFFFVFLLFLFSLFSFFILTRLIWIQLISFDFLLNPVINRLYFSLVVGYVNVTFF